MQKNFDGLVVHTGFIFHTALYYYRTRKIQIKNKERAVDTGGRGQDRDSNSGAHRVTGM
jgi:hypothetical protein